MDKMAKSSELLRTGMSALRERRKSSAGWGRTPLFFLSLLLPLHGLCQTDDKQSTFFMGRSDTARATAATAAGSGRI